MHRTLTTAASILVLGSVLAAPAGAAGTTGLKRDATTISAIAAGAVAAGPLGALAGAIGGAWLGEQVQRADQLPAVRAELAERERAVTTLEQDLAALDEALRAERRETARYARMALEQLELELLFRTGESRLTDEGRARLGLLAQFLAANPDIEVRVDGYADPRGRAEDNAILALDRAEAVAGALVDAAVPVSRVTVHGHGEERSQVAEGDLDGYALERRVRIELRRRGAAIASSD
ncbi:OmpA family protein [Pseudohaliea rubra]|uniref:Outer membrane protein n=1 Tax=Pseudohaliea rubra DSM 19751 TaxID=1265313 RepID=A0A095WVJ5_9GAMM|nr:OmpA family protein [Pseudohaliea rubra]KGE02664.1 Outer membrane protein [Pseudohaliea rubra DSM 19751]